MIKRRPDGSPQVLYRPIGSLPGEIYKHVVQGTSIAQSSRAREPSNVAPVEGRLRTGNHAPIGTQQLNFRIGEAAAAKPRPISGKGRRQREGQSNHAGKIDFRGMAV